MLISILNTSDKHPINEHLSRWICQNSIDHSISLCRSKAELVGGDLLFLVSCSEILGMNETSKFKKSLVIHASDLPVGRGWSPYVWEILNGSSSITVSLIEVAEKVDTGDIWAKVSIGIPKEALFDEINQLLFDAEIELMDYAVSNFETVTPMAQAKIKSSYWPKRVPNDSEIDIKKSIEQQFDLIRVCDFDRYPAFFYINGKKFKLKLEKMDE